MPDSCGKLDGCALKVNLNLYSNTGTLTKEEMMDLTSAAVAEWEQIIAAWWRDFLEVFDRCIIKWTNKTTTICMVHYH